VQLRLDGPAPERAGAGVDRGRHWLPEEREAFGGSRAAIWQVVLLCYK
jgi:hypothetical protein